MLHATLACCSAQRLLCVPDNVFPLLQEASAALDDTDAEHGAASTRSLDAATGGARSSLRYRLLVVAASLRNTGVHVQVVNADALWLKLSLNEAPRVRSVCRADCARTLQCSKRWQRTSYSTHLSSQLACLSTCKYSLVTLRARQPYSWCARSPYCSLRHRAISACHGRSHIVCTLVRDFQLLPYTFCAACPPCCELSNISDARAGQATSNDDGKLVLVAHCAHHQLHVCAHQPARLVQQLYCGAALCLAALLCAAAQHGDVQSSCKDLNGHAVKAQAIVGSSADCKCKVMFHGSSRWQSCPATCCWACL